MNEIYINVKQNQPESIRLLAAMRYLYGRAKIFKSVRVFITIMIPVISVLSLNFFPSFKHGIVFFSVIWLILNRIFFQEMEKNMIKNAAKMQESFDVDLFQIPWNDVLVGGKIPIEKIILLNEKSKEKEQNLKNWYPGLKSSNHFLNVLLAQRTNISWDLELRKFYVSLLICILLLYIIILSGFCFFMNLTTQSFMVSFLVPSLPLLLHLFETAYSHKQRYESLEKILPKITDNIENYSETVIDMRNTSRGYQDVVFLKRSDVNTVPDKVYWLKRTTYDRIAKEVNESHSNKQ